MASHGRRARHRRSFWLLLVGATLFLTVEPALFLVVLALGLSALAVAGSVTLVNAVVVDAVMRRRRVRRLLAAVNRGAPTAR